MRILCYGDSNTWGHNPANGNRLSDTQRWTKLLQNKMGQQHEIIEEGLCGRTAAFFDSVKPYRHGISLLKATLETHQPLDLVILMLGTNDLKVCFSPSAVSISNGIKEMVQIIKSEYTFNMHMKTPEILIVSPIYLKDEFDNIERTKEQFGKNGVVVSKKLSSYYEDIAKQYGCMFLDAAQYAQASGIDCIHMDEENHKKLAEAIYQKVMKC